MDYWPDEEPVISIFGTELIALREGDAVRLGSRERFPAGDDADHTFLVTDGQALAYCRQVAAAIGSGVAVIWQGDDEPARAEGGG